MAEEKATWNLKDVLAGKRVEDLIEEAKAKTEAFTRHQGKLDGTTPEELLTIIKEKEALGVLFGRIGGYYELKLSEDTQDQATLGAITAYEQLATELSNKLLFFRLWLIGLDKKEADKYLQAPALRDYRYLLRRLQEQKAHTKSSEVEEAINIMSTTSEAARHLYEVFTNAFTYTMDGKEGLTREEVVAYMQGGDPKLREEAYKTVLARYDEHSTILTEMYKTIVMDYNNEGVMIRGYKDSMDIRNVANDVTERAVQALLNVVRRNAGVFTDYFKIKHEMNGKAYPFSRYHLYAPHHCKTERQYGYEESKKMVLDTFKGFDQRFYEAANKMFTQEHVHSHPQKNKRSGAFNFSINTTTTPYMLLNHTGKLRDVFVMAHEAGHGVHGVFSQKQNETNYGYTLPLAETASIFGEMLLSERMLKESTSAEEKKHLLMYLLDNQYASITRQAYFVLFEEAAHKRVQQGATKQELEKTYYELLAEQFKGMQLSEDFSHEWNSIPHIHVSPFYCYAYAWGNLLVLSLYERYRKEGAAFKEKYVRLLSAGGSESPARLLSDIMGIDVESEEFWEEGFSIIKEEVESLKALR